MRICGNSLSYFAIVSLKLFQNKKFTKIWRGTDFCKQNLGISSVLTGKDNIN